LAVAQVFFVTVVGDDLRNDNLSSPTFGVFAGVRLDFWIVFAEVLYECWLTDA
jgi:hypothetical protein